MPSEKPLRILRRMGLSEDEISQHSDISAWRHIYANKPVPKVKPVTICFTGFADHQKTLLRSDAASLGLRVTDSVSGTTKYLCTGPNAGPSKIEKAQKSGAVIFDLSRFYEIFENGELPT